jgi:broad specificity phosphatase PhoE
VDRTELLLIRHGRVADGGATGGGADPDLSPDGHAQAQALAQRLSPTHKRLDAIYSSDLGRARQTAAPLAAAHGLAVCEREDLREADLGAWEYGELARRVAARDGDYLRFARSGRMDDIPEAETDAALITRASRAVDEIVGEHAGQTVALVIHLGVINAVLAELTGASRTIVSMMEHTSITVIHFLADGVRDLVVVNDAHHLYDVVCGRPDRAQ